MAHAHQRFNTLNVFCHAVRSPLPTLWYRQVPESKPQVFTLNLARVLDGTDTGQDLTLMPFDVVYVPKSPIANVNLWIDQYLRKNIPTSFGLSYQINDQS